MAAEDYYKKSIFGDILEIGRVDRRYQTSIVISQDPSKSGILSFLKQVEEVSSPPPRRPAPQTVRPRRSGATSGGGY